MGARQSFMKQGTSALSTQKSWLQLETAKSRSRRSTPPQRHCWGQALDTANTHPQENPKFSARLAAIFLKGISSPPIDPGWVFLAPVLS